MGLTIAYIRQDSRVFLDRSKSASAVGGWDERIALLRGASLRGHRVRVYGKLSSDDALELSKIKNTEHAGDQPVSKDVDLVFFDNGSTSPRHMTMQDRGFVTASSDAVLKLRDYHGPVFYHMSDLRLYPMVLPDVHHPSCGLTLEDVFYGKRWFVLTKAQDVEAFAVSCKNDPTRSFMCDIGMHARYFNMSCVIDEMLGGVEPTLKNHIVYVGHHRGRFDKIVKWYGHLDINRTTQSIVYGKWPDDLCDELRKNRIAHRGVLSNTDLRRVAGSSLFSIYITDKEYDDLRIKTTRFYEWIAGGGTLLFPRDQMRAFDGLVDDKFVLDDVSDVCDWIVDIAGMSFDERKAVRDEQFSWIENETPEKRMIELEQLHEEILSMSESEFTELSRAREIDYESVAR